MIFQASLNQGALPHIWKSGAIVPVYKKGSRTECSNYRPISLTCICSKILEHIIVFNISEHLDTHHVLCDEQHGFHHRRCCESQLISTIDDFASCLNKGGQCDVLFLDLVKLLTECLIPDYFTYSTTMAYVVLYWNSSNHFWLTIPNMLFWIIVVATKLMFYLESCRVLYWHLFYFYYILMIYHSVSTTE